MVAETHCSESSDFSRKVLKEEAIRGRRIEDELRLRELELQTNFQVQTLGDSLTALKVDFHSWRDSLNGHIKIVETEVCGMKTRLTVVIALAVVQLAGVPAVLTRLLGV